MIPATYKAHFSQICDNGYYKALLAKAYNRLIEKGVFQLVDAGEAAGRRVYNSRSVDEIKSKGTPDAYAKSRLVVQAFLDKEH